MFTVTLMTSPQAQSLDGPLIGNLRNVWGGGDVRWLAPGEAAEFAMPAMPDTLWQVWASLQDRGVDLVVQPTAGRRKRVLLADMDSTMIQQECIDELAAEAGVGDAVAAITARAMNGELDFEAALNARVGLLKDLDAAAIERVMAQRITYMPGGRTLVATMRAQGGHTVLVSGGFTAFAGPVAKALGFHESHANTLLICGGRLTGTVARPILGREAKVQTLRDVTSRLGVAPADVIAVGDGANDLGMLGLAGTGVALHAKPVVAAQCAVRINHADLTGLLYLQGCGRDEFVG